MLSSQLGAILPNMVELPFTTKKVTVAICYDAAIRTLFVEFMHDGLRVLFYY